MSHHRNSATAPLVGPTEVRTYIQLCRELGVVQLKVGALELVLGPAPEDNLSGIVADEVTRESEKDRTPANPMRRQLDELMGRTRRAS